MKAKRVVNLLFVLRKAASGSRHLGIDPEAALRKTNNKFTTRFAFIEIELEKRGLAPKDSNLVEMDALWNQAKQFEHGL